MKFLDKCVIEVELFNPRFKYTTMCIRMNMVKMMKTIM